MDDSDITTSSQVAPKLGYIPGKPSQSSLMGVICFFSPIFSYFCLFVAALRPCHGRLPRRKYMKTWPRDSRSSRRDCSRNVNMSMRSDDTQMTHYTHLDQDACWCSCIAQCHWDSCVPCRECVALSLDLGIAWPYQNRQRGSLDGVYG